MRVRVVANQTPTTNNGTTHYVWDIFGQIIAEANGSSGATLRETIYLDSMPLAAIDAAAVPKKTYAVHVDHLNRPIMLTDATKVNVWWASFEPFGKVRTTGGTLTQNLGLPGQWFQLESGLAHNWHRHYDPTTGRYTTADPLGFVDGPGVFAYVSGLPHLIIDLLGLDGSGHHWVPRAIWKDAPFSPAVKEIFNNASTGALPDPRVNYFDRLHRPYNAACIDVYRDFIRSRGVTPETMTTDQARELVSKIKGSNDPRIINFNNRLANSIIDGLRRKYGISRSD
jgi:RHS repeat-associated protein